MNLYAIAGTCSLAPHIILQLTGAPFDLHLLDRIGAEQKSKGFLSINPRGKVPALVDDGEVILENVTIQFYLATKFPHMELMPTERVEQQNWLTFLTWCSNSVHVSFRRFRRPELYSTDQEAWSGISASGKSDFMVALSEFDARLKGKKWLFGESFTTADAYMHVFHLWARTMGFTVDSLPNLARHGRQMMDIAAVKQAFVLESISLSVFS